MTSLPQNHKHFFIGMESGEIYIFDLVEQAFDPLVLSFESVFPKQPVDTIMDIKCHNTKMHRLLIAYPKTAVVVFSLNKYRVIRQIDCSAGRDDPL